MADAIRESWMLMIVLGLFVGAFASLFGLGGGVIMVPLLVLLLGYEQKAAQATSLGMILSPFAAPGLWVWHKQGLIEWRTVFFLAPSLTVGSYFGGLLGTHLPQALMKVIFALVLTYIAAYMIFGKVDMAKGFAYALVPVAVTAAMAWAMGAFDMTTATQPAEAEDVPYPAEEKAEEKEAPATRPAASGTTRPS